MIKFVHSALLALLVPAICFAAVSPTSQAQQKSNPSAKPRSDAAAIHFPKGQASVQLPLELRANGPFVMVKINGKGPFNFEVDTGAMTSPLAAELMNEMGYGAATVAKQNTAEFTLADGLSVTIPKSSAEFAGLWPLVGQKIYGAIGYGVLKHFVVEFDYEHKMLTLYDPQKFHYSGAGATFHASLMMGYDPQIAGAMAVPGAPPIPARFTLDTGAGGTVISSPIVKKHNLMERVTEKVPNPPSKPAVDGVDGQVFDTVTARISGLQLGKYTVDRPLVAFSTDSDGTFAMDSIGINLGSNILRRFKVIIDYPRQIVILEPNSHFSDPFAADASGLVLQAEGADFKTVVVHGVVAGSAAAESEIREGDIITAIDGEPLEKYALWQIQDLLKESGQEKRLTIKRGNATSIQTIKLRALA
jgi:hypothetical protein